MLALIASFDLIILSKRFKGFVLRSENYRNVYFDVVTVGIREQAIAMRIQ